MKSQEVVPVVCPNCRVKYNAPVTSIINVDQNPTLKNTFLQGQINLNQCPQCGFSGPLEVPVLYHDSQKELAFVLVPGNLHLSHAAEQKIIGDLTNRVMNALPPEQRKMYLFSPQIFLTMDNLAKAVLAADGITEAMIKTQEERLALIDKLIKATSEEELTRLVQEHNAELDYQFFETLTVMTVQILQTGDQIRGQNMLAFRQVVAQLSDRGQEFITQLDEKAGLRTLNPERLLDDLKQANTDDEFMALVSAGRSLLDYSFFQTLTDQIDAAEATKNKAEAEKLKALRSRILDASAKIDKAARKAMDKAAKLLTKLLESPDPRPVIVENLDQFNDTFIALLAANIQEAEQAGKAEVAKRLTQLYQAIMTTLQEQAPPEMVLLNQLMEAGSPEAITTILQQNKALITPDFINFLTHLQADFENRGQAEVGLALAEIKKQAEAMK